MRILFTGGGTGGHLFPIIAVARQLKVIYGHQISLEFCFLGAGKLSQTILEKEEIKTKVILTGKLRRYFSILNLLDIFKFPIGFLQSLWYVFIWMPDVVFSKGGYGSVPVVLVAWLYRIPVLAHESDAIPGLANQLGAKFSKRIALSFEKSQQYFPSQKTALIGNPIRSSVIQKCLSENPQDKERAKEFFKIVTQKPIIFILGGSQGALAINEMLINILPQLLSKYEIIHQSGQDSYDRIMSLIGQNIPKDYHLFSFLNEDQIASAYLLADLVVSRAGAGSISEIAACAKPSIIIPLPNSASGHQRENAFAYARKGAAVVLEQDNLTPNLLFSQINKILDEQNLRSQMSQNAKNFSRPDAAQRIAQALIEIGK